MAVNAFLLGPIWTTRPIVIARWSVAGTIPGELQQFLPIQLAVAIRVEVHCMFDHPLGRRWASRTASRPTVVGRAIIGARSVARFFAATGALGSTAGTHQVAAAITFETGARSVRSTRSTIAGTGTGTIGSGAAWAGAAVIRTPSTTTAAPGRSTGGPQFVLGQFAVAVLVELFEGGGSVGDFLSGEDAVVVGVEGFHERIGRPPLAPPAWRSLRRPSVVAGRRTLRALFIVALRTPFRRLGHNDHRTERTNYADRSQKVFRSKHVDLPANQACLICRARSSCKTRP
jgi:hypothetical protein